MRKRYVVFYAFFLILFGLLGYLAHQFSSFPGDAVISQWIKGINFPFFAPLMEAVSDLGSGVSTVVTVLVIVTVLWYFKRRLEAVFVASLPALAGLLNYLLKLLVDRPRPGDDLLGGGLSFPSGHTTYAVVLFGFLCYLAPVLIKRSAAARMLQLLLVVLILFTGISRVYLGSHWPSDILGSLLFGGLMLAPAVVIYHNYAGQEKLEE